MVFQSPFQQHAERNGQTCRVVGEVPRDTYDVAECGPLRIVEFDDGVRIEAWPEELHEEN